MRRSQPPDPASLLNLLRREVPKGKASLREIEVLLELMGRS